MNMVLFVLNDPEALDDLLTAWEEAGVKGITVLPSTGLGRLRQYALFEDLPLIPSLDDMEIHLEKLSRTLFTICDDEHTIDRLVEATQKVVGNLNEPNTGILAVIPLARVYGLNKIN